ncbi:LysE family translocator [Noviherbaspirillum pedocola]|uniref:LysE family translocator n=1 Tax=Noviherbaspirillum pedocola TaxID=2801341 RepID=A0A934W214_9BURK|nr:LysE family translocator [Noviherbaspirillum pedocola]MBK4735806.1 LysE family translocator [Noviherbaspirillum pedocola]
MLTADQALAFLAAAMLITISPGPDNLMVLGFGMARGRARGIAFGLGCAFGCLSHTVLAALGISGLIAASPLAFGALRIAGGLYLVWMGIGALRSGGGAKAVALDGPDVPLPRLFARGLVANAINPKVALFFLSFLPQFVVAQRGDVPWQTAQLGLIFTLQAAFLFGLLGFFAGSIGAWLNRRPRAGLWLDRAAGMVFVGLGLKLIWGR